MDVSVILCTYNRCESLGTVLESLKNLRGDPRMTWELIVVDNNSKDRTKEVVEGHVRSGGGTTRYLFEGKQGKSHALNAGIKAAQGEIVAFTDDDVTIDPDWLRQLKHAFDRHQCMAIAGRIIPVWTCERPSWFNEDGPYRLMTAIVKYDLGDEPCPVTTPAWGANMAFRKSIFDKYGLFRTDLGPNAENLIRGEDSEFCWRLIRGRESFMYAPKAVVFHPVEENRTKKNYFKSWYFDYGRSEIRTHGIPQNAVSYVGVPRYLFRHCIMNFLKWNLAFNSRQRFYHKLNLYQVAGQIVEAYGRRTTPR